MSAAGPARRPRPHPGRVALLLSDVDGTLVTKGKILTDASRRAVAGLRATGIRFAVTSSRPPAGLRMIVEALRIDTPVAAFNAGMIVAPGGDGPASILAQHLLPAEVGAQALAHLAARGVDAWVFTADRWLVRNPEGVRVDHEARTVQFGPTVVDDFAPFLGGVGKIVGANDDFELLARCEAELRELLGATASVARSQAYYLDVTHPLANKGTAVRELARRLGIPAGEIAVIGDGFNDVAMFRQAGLAIAMGNAAPEVQAAADLVTASNEEDGFALAVARHLLGRAEA